MVDEKILALDFDGVISNPYHLKLKYINDFGYNIKMNECTYGLCVKTNKVDPHHYKVANEKALNSGSDKIKLVDGFLEHYNLLQRFPLKIYIITARSNYQMNSLIDILDFYNLKFYDIINTNGRSKIEALSLISADTFVEDNSFFLSQVVKEFYAIKKSKDINFVYYKNEMNVNEKLDDPRIKTVNNWNSLYEYLVDCYRFN